MSWELTEEKVTPSVSPQYTTERSDFIAAKPLSPALIHNTFTRNAETEEESPPLAESPQVTTVPSVLIAAKAEPVL